MEKRKNNPNRRYESFLSDEFEEVAKKHEVDVQDVKDAFYYLWVDFKGFIVDPRMPPVFLDFFGTFTPTVGKFNWVIKNRINQLRRGHGDREKFFKFVKRVWPIRARLLQERYNSVKSTWRLWRDSGKIGKKYNEEKQEK